MGIDYEMEMTEMRKVFFSTVMMTPDNPGNRVVYQSRDFDMGDRNYFAPISYLLDANIDENDDILIITTLTQTTNPENNYKILRKEMEEILEAHKAKASFVEIYEPDHTKQRDEMDSLTFSRHFQEISDYFQDGDRIYADMTFGMKCNTICSLIAMSYAAKAGQDVDVDCMVYAQYYRGDTDTSPTSDIIDITSLFYINTLVNNTKPGQKKSTDEFLRFMIG